MTLITVEIDYGFAVRTLSYTDEAINWPNIFKTLNKDAKYKIKTLIVK